MRCQQHKKPHKTPSILAIYWSNTIIKSLLTEDMLWSATAIDTVTGAN